MPVVQFHPVPYGWRTDRLGAFGNVAKEVKYLVIKSNEKSIYIYQNLGANKNSCQYVKQYIFFIGLTFWSLIILKVCTALRWVNL